MIVCLKLMEKNRAIAQDPNNIPKWIGSGLYNLLRIVVASEVHMEALPKITKQSTKFPLNTVSGVFVLMLIHDIISSAPNNVAWFEINGDVSVGCLVVQIDSVDDQSWFVGVVFYEGEADIHVMSSFESSVFQSEYLRSDIDEMHEESWRGAA